MDEELTKAIESLTKQMSDIQMVLQIILEELFADGMPQEELQMDASNRVDVFEYNHLYN